MSPLGGWDSRTWVQGRSHPRKQEVEHLTNVSALDCRIRKVSKATEGVFAIRGRTGPVPYNMHSVGCYGSNFRPCF